MASSPQQPLTSITLKRSRKRAAASKLHKIHTEKTGHKPPPPPPPPSPSPSPSPSSPPPVRPIRVVCVADTHNRRPALPPGDVLIHAGDLTELGSFDEMQSQLLWLSTQPHPHKILVAGNHDLLLDDAFLAAHPERRHRGDPRTRHDLDWGDVTYLEDGAATLAFLGRRTLTVFGSPWTPQYGVSAFQYGPDDAEDRWAGGLAAAAARGTTGGPTGPTGPPDVVVTHGPPRHHLDRRGLHQAGCPHLAAAIAEARPRLVVFGHIHAGYGREDGVVLDGVQRVYEEAMTGWAGWGDIGWMAALVVWAKLTGGLRRRLLGRADRTTTFVNAAVVGGPSNELRNEPIVVEL